MTATKLKAIVFDMDDTLLDWSKRTQDWSDYDRYHLELVYNYIANQVHPITSLDEFCNVYRQFTREAWFEAMNGLRAPMIGDVIARALQHFGVPDEQIDIAACLEVYDWQPIGGVEPYPDAVEILPLLAEHGVHIGLITNAYQPMWMRDRELHAYGLLQHFADCRISAADVGYLKPHPAIFEAALECLNADADEVVFVGDNPEADIAGAQSVGMRAVLRVGHRKATLISGLIVPDGAINTLHELLPMLDEWYPDWRKQNPEGEVTSSAQNA